MNCNDFGDQLYFCLVLSTPSTTITFIICNLFWFSNCKMSENGKKETLIGITRGTHFLPVRRPLNKNWLDLSLHFSGYIN